MDVIGSVDSRVISYSFFTPKNLHSHLRFWDKYNTHDRYWYNIPAMVVCNSIFYPEFKIKLHISREILENPLYEIFEKISQEFSNFEIVIMDYDYSNTEPTMWRYKPIFDKEFDLVLCRDIDSLPTSDELRATRYFIENENYLVHTLRTHTNHATVPTIILAGLCGFKPKKIPFIQGFDFERYYNHFKNPNWGLDQNSLIGIFAPNKEWTQNHFLDSPISTVYHNVGNCLLPCKSLNQDFYKDNVNLGDDKTNLIQFLDSHTTWAGEPIDIRFEKLSNLLSMGYDACEKMKNCLSICGEVVKNFYLKNV